MRQLIKRAWLKSQLRIYQAALTGVICLYLMGCGRYTRMGMALDSIERNTKMYNHNLHKQDVIENGKHGEHFRTKIPEFVTDVFGKKHFFFDD
jgi:hypothetical protein